MDKKKVIEQIEDTILMVDTIEGFDDGDTEQLLNVRRKLNDALEELSKSDWISVEDELPPRDTYVWVRSIANPDVVWTARRATLKEFDTESLDSNDFITFGHSSITHWRKIDKLEI